MRVEVDVENADTNNKKSFTRARDRECETSAPFRRTSRMESDKIAVSQKLCLLFTPDDDWKKDYTSDVIPGGDDGSPRQDKKKMESND